LQIWEKKHLTYLTRLREDTHRSTLVTQTQTIRYKKPALTVNEVKYVLANLDNFTGSHRRRIKLLLHSLLASDVQFVRHNLVKLLVKLNQDVHSEG
jgi:hypothetical protein